MAALHLGDARADAVPRQPAADEDDVPVEACDAVAAVRERLDVELDLLVSRHRCGHAASLAVPRCQTPETVSDTEWSAVRRGERQDERRTRLLAEVEVPLQGAQ